jgi:cation:H+ antiporter
VDIGVSVVVLAVIATPIAGEMPEKISMIMLARRSGSGASIAPVLGSEILNNTLFLAFAVFAAMRQVGFYVNIEPKPILSYQVILVTVFILIALIPMFVQKEIGLKVGVMLASMFVIGIFIQFLLL